LLLKSNLGTLLGSLTEELTQFSGGKSDSRHCCR
jgi:hypothetical protein